MATTPTSEPTAQPPIVTKQQMIDALLDMGAEADQDVKDIYWWGGRCLKLVEEDGIWTFDEM